MTADGTGRLFDEWDGNQHKAHMCVSCIVSGMIATYAGVTTVCGLYIDTTTQQNTNLPKCEKCAKVVDDSSEDVCGFCGDPTNKRWK